MEGFYYQLERLEWDYKNLEDKLELFRNETNNQNFEVLKLALELCNIRGKILYFNGIMVFPDLDTDNMLTREQLQFEYLNTRTLRNSVNEKYNELLKLQTDQKQSFINNTYESFLPTGQDDALTLMNKAHKLRMLDKKELALEVYDMFELLYGDTSEYKDYIHYARKFTQQLDLVSGVYVYEVVPASVAEKYGIKKSDILVTYNQTLILSTEDLLSLVNENNKTENEVQLYRIEDDTLKLIQVLVPSGLLGIQCIDL